MILTGMHVVGHATDSFGRRVNKGPMFVALLHTNGTKESAVRMSICNGYGQPGISCMHNHTQILRVQ